jgi:DNA-binding HxlR family transcriptional regulator
MAVNFANLSCFSINSTNYSNQVFLEDRCTLNELISLLSKRWMTDVLFSIEEGNNRFTTLKEELQHISDNILADRLRALEAYGLISKKSFNEIPPRVEYAITPTGSELSLLLDRLCKFSEETMHAPEQSVRGGK